ncbi:uncharacterized protein LOC135367615 [Ornithodoros turicata]|uniref:uncharacterized protein LOC135367615 n=1 Tax=Ornithodoros turicata TaxID=34597 RepID=UPI0031389BDF
MPRVNFSWVHPPLDGPPTHPPTHPPLYPPPRRFFHPPPRRFFHSPPRRFFHSPPRRFFRPPPRRLFYPPPRLFFLQLFLCHAHTHIELYLGAPTPTTLLVPCSCPERPLPHLASSTQPPYHLHPDSSNLPSHSLLSHYLKSPHVGRGPTIILSRFPSSRGGARGGPWMRGRAEPVRPGGPTYSN